MQAARDPPGQKPPDMVILIQINPLLDGVPFAGSYDRLPRSIRRYGGQDKLPPARHEALLAHLDLLLMAQLAQVRFANSCCVVCCALHAVHTSVRAGLLSTCQGALLQMAQARVDLQRRRLLMLQYLLI